MEGVLKSWAVPKGPSLDPRAKRPESVVSGRLLDEIATAQDQVWHSNRAGKRAAHAGPPPKIEGARKAALPPFIAPQLATLVGTPPDGDTWVHELKYDGYRMICRVDDGDVRFLSRNGNDWTDRFPHLTRAVNALELGSAMLDGEVAVLKPDGTTSFQELQNAISGRSNAPVFYAFDLLHLHGYDLTNARLEDRKALLESLLGDTAPGHDVIIYSQHLAGSGADFLQQACRFKLEGMISKRRDAPYRSGRGQQWLKIKCHLRQEVVIGGYTTPTGRKRLGLSSLLAGLYDDDGKLRYVGRIGTGFTDKTLRELTEKLRALEQAASPFKNRVTGRAAGRTRWVKPVLLAEVEFGEWTRDGRMRHPSFQGLRADKTATQAVREVPAPVPPVDAKPRGRRARNGDKRVVVQGIELSNHDRVLYPEIGLTKLDLAHYYETIAEHIVPHLHDRPTSLVRCPDGLGGKCFYQKHIRMLAPEPLRRIDIQEKLKVGEYLVVDTLPALIALVQMNILEIHTWNSTASDIEHPNRIVIDLDPGPQVEWPRVVAAAQHVRQRFQLLDLESFVKTTGGKGLHIVAPIERRDDWDGCATFARVFAESMERDDPAELTTTMSKARRANKILIDHLRNVRGATSVAAFSTRAKPRAPVSVPLDWDELGPRIGPDHYTVENILSRLKAQKADPWERYWRVKQYLPARD